MSGGFHGRGCICDGLFKGFKWGSLKMLKSRELPAKRGVYILRLVVDETAEPSALYEGVDLAYSEGFSLLEKAGWSSAVTLAEGLKELEA